MIRKKLAFIGFLFLFLFSHSVYANLMISPKRVIFEDRERSAYVNLINSSKATKTYRLGLVDIVQTETGGIITKPTAADLNQLHSAKEMLRYSPRQVRLAPGEVQKIRIAARRPANLPAGEYRTHLMFTELPGPQAVQMQDSAQIKLHMLMSFTIPVFVRSGAYNSEVSLSQLKIVNEGGKQKVVFDIQRLGDYGVNGKATLYWQPNLETQPTKIAELNNIAVYRETKIRRSVGFSLENTQPLKKGIYKVVYTGDAALNHRNLGSAEFVY